ncbi:hypothetical protein CCACVL1_05573 [Corchorus capsularis]|uniref:Uncharacterized protein n=1 Tax=Corchorus capsularis TaxID=210143 RepID=A0A1R3JJW1_COCAP|nr:hypothetical protein CCACVL1_05573 [Corchorus capsularis]
MATNNLPRRTIKGPAHVVRDASCWQREHEWWQDIAVAKLI